MNREVTSTVFPNPTEWWHKAFLVPHEPIRRDLNDMVRVLNPKVFKAGGLPKWKFDTFFDWYKRAFYFFVHHHHDVEETIYMPFVKTRCALPPKISEDHKGLLHRMEYLRDYSATVEAAFAANDAQAIDKAADRLYELATELREYMLPHLSEEEEQVGPLLSKNFTQAEEEVVTSSIIKSLGIEGNRRMLPWIVHTLEIWANEDVQASFWRSVPAPIRLVYWQWWRPAYERDIVPLLPSILANKQYTPPKGSSPVLPLVAAVGALAATAWWFA